MQGDDAMFLCILIEVHRFMSWLCTVCQMASVFIMPMPCLLSSRGKVSAEAAGWLPPGVLTYFMDGILPLLRVGADTILSIWHPCQSLAHSIYNLVYTI